MTLALVEQVNTGQQKATEIIQAHLERASKDSLNAFISLNPNALEQAKAVDTKVAAGQHLPLAGYPWQSKTTL